MTLTYSLASLTTAAQQFVEYLKASELQVVIFEAPMGAGKTTFITEVCKQLGVNAVISSPTYAIINEYGTQDGKTVNHMDWYRLEDEEEAIDAGVEDALYQSHYSFVEWPSKAEGLLPLHYLKATIDITSDTERSMTIEKI